MDPSNKIRPRERQRDVRVSGNVTHHHEQSCYVLINSIHFNERFPTFAVRVYRLLVVRFGRLILAQQPFRIIFTLTSLSLPFSFLFRLRCDVSIDVSHDSRVTINRSAHGLSSQTMSGCSRDAPFHRNILIDIFKSVIYISVMRFMTIRAQMIGDLCRTYTAGAINPPINNSRHR